MLELDCKIDLLKKREADIRERELLARERLVQVWHSELEQRERQVMDLETKVAAFETAKHAVPQMTKALDAELADKTADAMKAVEAAEQVWACASSPLVTARGWGAEGPLSGAI